MSVKLEHLGGDRYRTRVGAGRDPITRKYRQVSITFKAPSKKAAKEQHAANEVKLRRQLRDEAQMRGTVAELVAAWQRHRTTRTHSPYTLNRERVICDRIVARLGPVKLTDLTPLHVDEFYAWLRGLDANLSESTIHHHHRVLRAILRQGADWGQVDRVATAAARAPRVRRQPVRPPAPADLGALVSTLPEGLAVPVAVLAQTGMRRGELMGLRWSDVDLAGQVIHVERSVVELPGQPLADKAPKSGVGRDVWISPIVVELLARWRVTVGDLGPEARVFPNLELDPSGRTPMRPGWLSLAWKRHCAKHGVRVRLHDLRHYYASQMLDQGVPMSAVQEQLGHAQLSTTLNIYGHRTVGAEERARLALEALLPGS